MSKAPPAFQFYPDSFEQGTTTFTLAEVGGYVRLLNHQWAHGSIPGDDACALSRIMRCTVGTAKSVWKIVGGKFPQTDGQYQNARLERERQKQQERRASLIGNAKKGAEAKAAQKQLLQQELEQMRQQKLQQTASLSSSSSSPDPSVPLNLSPPPSTPSVAAPPLVRGGGLITNSLMWDKHREKFAHFGPRLRIPHILHDELRAKLGGENPTMRLLAWYQDLDAEVEQSGEAIPDIFVWLRPKFVEWALQVVSEAEKAKFLREVGHGR